MKSCRLLLLDSDSYTSAVLVEKLVERGFENVQRVSSALELPNVLTDAKPDAVIFNYHSDRPDSLTACSGVKLMAPQAAIIAIVSPGPALKTVRVWSKQTQCIDVIVEKSLSDDRFFMALEDLLRVKVSLREMQTKTELLANLLPEEAVSAIESNFNSEAELFDAAVLFTDIRGSSQLIREMPPRVFFELLNRVLSLQATHITRYRGSVVKYTGDGVMAIFRGMGRSYLALRCALDLAGLGRDQKLPYGVGVAEGLVLAGLIGDSNQSGQRRQYDVIGATAHLAARLCSMAKSGEVIATKSMNAVARLNTPAPRPIGNVSIRGFDRAIDCIAFIHPNLKSGTT